MADSGESRQSPHPLKRPLIDEADYADTNGQPNEYLTFDSQLKTAKRTRNTPDELLVASEDGHLQQNDDSEDSREQIPTLGDEENADEDDVSEISDLSGLSEETWRPSAAGPLNWVHQQISEGVDPRPILQHLIADEDDSVIPSFVDDLTIWKIIINILSEPPPRKKLEDVNTLDQVIQLLRTCQKIMVLTGAGVSVSCGIPDFRSKDGIYSRLAVEYPDLPDPQAMFDIHYFVKNQKPFFKFAKEIYPGQFQPSPSHKFIQMLEERNKLLRNYTQNIDTLEQVAGIHNVVQCHGSFANATCMTCKHKADAEDIKEDIMNQVIPRCPRCPADEPLGIMKPDIVFFGENLPQHFHRQMDEDKDECDLLIVMGSSLKVRPVALIPSSIPANVPQILINRETLKHLNFDVELLGDCDAIVNELCQRLGSDWSSMCNSDLPMQQIACDELITPPPAPSLTSSTNLSSVDENSRMSYQNAMSDENSCMSVQEEAVETSQTQNAATLR